jgi:hypothetical protein
MLLNFKKFKDKLWYAKVQMVTFQCYRFLRNLRTEIES